mgnify:CR=1 FL=1
MITDKDIIVELLRQREELRDELAASKTGQEDKECVDELNEIIAVLRERLSLAQARTDPKEYRFIYKGMDYIVVDVEKFGVESLTERDKLKEDNLAWKERVEAALEERDAWKTRHDDLVKRSAELRSKYDQLLERGMTK